MVSGLSGYLVLAGVTVAGMLLFAAAIVARRLLAPRAPSLAGLATYESGVDPVGTGWAQFRVRYVAYALLYVVFAVDSVFLFPWALVLHHKKLGVASFVEVVIFVAVLLVALAHAGRRRLLTWDDSVADEVED